MGDNGDYISTDMKINSVKSSTQEINIDPNNPSAFNEDNDNLIGNQ